MEKEVQIKVKTKTKRELNIVKLKKEFKTQDKTIEFLIDFWKRNEK